MDWGVVEAEIWVSELLELGKPQIGNNSNVNSHPLSSHLLVSGNLDFHQEQRGLNGRISTEPCPGLLAFLSLMSSVLFPQARMPRLR